MTRSVFGLRPKEHHQSFSAILLIWFSKLVPAVSCSQNSSVDTQITGIFELPIGLTVSEVEP